MPKSKHELLSLMNVGKAVLKDLQLLGISSIATLKDQNALELYKRLQDITKTRQDPCVLDVFAAIIHEAKTGEKIPWWHFSNVRKTATRLQKND